jgi:hypothetical protein
MQLFYLLMITVTVHLSPRFVLARDDDNDDDGDVTGHGTKSERDIWLHSYSNLTDTNKQDREGSQQNNTTASNDTTATNGTNHN